MVRERVRANFGKATSPANVQQISRVCLRHCKSMILCHFDLTHVTQPAVNYQYSWSPKTDWTSLYV